MIGWLNGRVLHQLRNGALLLDVQGVGYEVHVASNELPPFDELIELFVFTVVRETPFSSLDSLRSRSVSF